MPIDEAIGMALATLRSPAQPTGGPNGFGRKTMSSGA
jgi:hypothetical protein